MPVPEIVMLPVVSKGQIHHSRGLDLQNRNENDELDEYAFLDFLTKVTGFIWAYAVIHPGVNALRTPIYPEMVNLVQGNPISFKNYLLNVRNVEELMRQYSFTNQRPFTKSMLVWWAFQRADQEILDLDTKLQVEHIFAKKRQSLHQELSDDGLLESIGNKAFLEARINIGASDYRFDDKRRHYRGEVFNKDGSRKPATRNAELIDLASSESDFGEAQIVERAETMISAFGVFLREQGLAAD